MIVNFLSGMVERKRQPLTKIVHIFYEAFYAIVVSKFAKMLDQKKIIFAKGVPIALLQNM